MIKRIPELIIILIAGLLLFWFYVAFKFSRIAEIMPPGDFQRDTAITYNIINGNILWDAAYLNKPAWYPFLSHAIYAVFNIITRIPVEVLYLKNPFILSIPTIGLFIFSVQKIFKSLSVTLVALFAFLFIFPWTSHHLHVVTHPFVLAYGTLTLAIYLFWKAATSHKLKNWIAAGLGIAIVIYSQPFAALTLCGGIVLYQLIKRENWSYFFIMVIVAFIFSSPLVVPMLFYYKLHTINTTTEGFLQYSLTLDNLLYGYGNFRWLNSSLIIIGILKLVSRKNKIDIFLLCLYFFGLFFILWGLLTTQVSFLSGFHLPRSFVWQDMMLINHLMAVFIFVQGLLFLIKNKIVLLIPVLIFYSLFMLPKFIERASSWYPVQHIYFPYDDNWKRATEWIRTNTAINDVFIAHTSSSYLFISGLTGRKVVVTDNWHSNPFVDQAQRVGDLINMYSTNDINEFKVLAKKYNVKYVVVSPNENIITTDGLYKFIDKSNFQPVFSSGQVNIYRVYY